MPYFILRLTSTCGRTYSYSLFFFFLLLLRIFKDTSFKNKLKFKNFWVFSDRCIWDFSVSLSSCKGISSSSSWNQFKSQCRSYVENCILWWATDSIWGYFVFLWRGIFHNLWLVKCWKGKLAESLLITSIVIYVNNLSNSELSKMNHVKDCAYFILLKRIKKKVTEKVSTTEEMPWDSH